MSKSKPNSWFPNSGEVIGVIAKAFRLDDLEIGGPASASLNATTDKTAQRFFGGVRIDHESADILVRQFGKALFHSGIFGHLEGNVQTAASALPWEEVYVESIAAHAKMWDMDFWQAAAVFPRADRRLAALIFARQVVIELTLRFVALIRLGVWQRPTEETPWWATKQGFGSFLRRIKESCPKPPSGSALAKALLVDDSTVDRWFAGKEVPNLVHADALARAFAEALPDHSKGDLLIELRRAVGIASLVARLRQVVGDEAIERLGKAMHRFVKWTLETTDREQLPMEELQAECAEIMVLGTAHPLNVPILTEWADREREIPWSDDILWSAPLFRAERVKHSLRIVGESERRQADLREVMPNQPDSVRQMISEIAAWRGISTPRITPEMAAKIASGEHKVYRISGPDSMKAENRMMQADQAANSGDFDTACVHACRAVHLQPDRADYRYSYGCYLWQAKRYSDGLEQLRKSCELKPGWDRSFVEIAIAYINWGRMDEAQFHLENGPADMREQSDFYQFTLARIYRVRKEFASALACCERAIALNPNHAEAFDLAADCAFILGERDKGERYAKEGKHRGAFSTFARWQAGFYGAR